MDAEEATSSCLYPPISPASALSPNSLACSTSLSGDLNSACSTPVLEEDILISFDATTQRRERSTSQGPATGPKNVGSSDDDEEIIRGKRRYDF